MHKRIHPRPDGVPADLGAPGLPGSKSHAQRALLLASLLPGRTELRGVPDNDDLRVLATLLKARGVSLETDGDLTTVDGVLARSGERVAMAAGENATAARMVLALLPWLGCEVTVDGHERLRRRPMGAVTTMLRDAGIEVSADRLPIRAGGGARPQISKVRVDASTTTQPASGALLGLALAGGGGLEVDRPAATGYLELTAQVLRDFGAEVTSREHASKLTFDVGAFPSTPRDPAGRYPTRRYDVPNDPSARTFVAVLAAMHGRSLPAGLAGRERDPHPEWQVDSDIAQLLAAGENDVILVDLQRRPDCVPALAVLAAQRAGRTVLSNLANLRAKESDRLQALAIALTAVGVYAVVDGDDLVVSGPLPVPAATLTIPTVPDHRIVMAMALLGTVLPAGVVVQHAEAVAKSWPTFWDWLGRCARVEA